MRRWLSASSDAKERRFIQVGDTLFHSQKFKVLSSGAKILYLYCAMESAGQQNFQMPVSCAEKYGIPSSSLRRYLKELEENHFIQVTRSGKNTRTANDYQFCFDWLNE